MLVRCTRGSVEMTSTEEAVDRRKLEAWLDEMTGLGVPQTLMRRGETGRRPAGLRVRGGEPDGLDQGSLTPSG